MERFGDMEVGLRTKLVVVAVGGENIVRPDVEALAREHDGE